jgi:hypothetical protein
MHSTGTRLQNENVNGNELFAAFNDVTSKKPDSILPTSNLKEKISLNTIFLSVAVVSFIFPFDYFKSKFDFERRLYSIIQLRKSGIFE